MRVLKPAGLWLRLFLELNKYGWRKKFTAEDIEKLVGVSRRYAYTLLETMEKNGLVETWYELREGSAVRYYRMRLDKIKFTDGYLIYEFSSGLFGGVDINLPKDQNDQMPEEEENNQEPFDLNEKQETDTPSKTSAETQE